MAEILSEDISLNPATVVETPTPASSTAASLLLIIGEPFNVEQKDLILERIVTELSTWDAEAAKCDINEQLGLLSNQQPTKAEDPTGEKVFEYKTELLVAVILVNPRIHTVCNRLATFLLAESCYRYLLYSGPAVSTSGSWFLQDGYFSFAAALEVFRRHEVVEAMSRQQGITFDISAFGIGSDWSEASVAKLSPHWKVRVVRPNKVLGNENGLIQFSDNISGYLKATPCVESMHPTEVVGSVSFVRPSAYIFPGGQGDSMLFGVSGFTLLVNGGYNRRSCFWDFIRHISRVDALLVSHLGPDSCYGLSSFFERKSIGKLHPDLGVVFMNVGDTKHLSPNGSTTALNGLLLSLAEEGRGMVEHLHHMGISPHPCLGSLHGTSGISPISLYFKVGHGSLDMYVLNPMADSKELKEFLTSWSKSVDSFKGGVPVSDQTSICALFVWKPASTKEPPVRLLMPGNAPQSKIFEGLDKLKNVAMFHNISGLPEKVAAIKAPAEKKPANTAAAKPSAPAKQPTGKLPTSQSGHAIGSKPESKEAKKPAGATDHKTASVPTLDHKSAIAEQKEKSEHKSNADAKKTETKKEHKDSKKPAEVKNGKSATPVATASPRRDSPNKAASTKASKESKAKKPETEKKVAAAPASESKEAAKAGDAKEEVTAHPIENIPQDEDTPPQLIAVTTPDAETTPEVEAVPLVEPTPLVEATPEAVEEAPPVNGSEIPLAEEVVPEDGTNVVAASESSEPTKDSVDEEALLSTQLHALPDPSLDQMGQFESSEYDPKSLMHLPSELETTGVKSEGDQPKHDDLVGDNHPESGGESKSVDEKTDGAVSQSTEEPVSESKPDLVESSEDKVEESEKTEESFDPQKDWGQPEALPAPMNGKEPEAAVAAGGEKNPRSPTKKSADGKKAATARPTTAPEKLNATIKDEKEDKGAANRSMASASTNKKGRADQGKKEPATAAHPASARADSKKQPLKPVAPFYVDLAYIPSHGDLRNMDLDFFRRVRARNYVLSSAYPDPKVFSLLLDAKATWEDSDSMEVCIIPTYDCEALIRWMDENKDRLSHLKVKVGPSANRCTLQLNEQDTSCAAYRLEF